MFFGEETDDHNYCGLHYQVLLTEITESCSNGESRLFKNMLSQNIMVCYRFVTVSVVPVLMSHCSSGSSSGTLIPSIIVPEPDSSLFMVLVPVLELFFLLH